MIWDERKHGFPAEPVPVAACVGSSRNLTDLMGGTGTARRRVASALGFRGRGLGVG